MCNNRSGFKPTSPKLAPRPIHDQMPTMAMTQLNNSQPMKSTDFVGPTVLSLELILYMFTLETRMKY